jgi:hypothetical protein
MLASIQPRTRALFWSVSPIALLGIGVLLAGFTWWRRVADLTPAIGALTTLLGAALCVQSFFRRTELVAIRLIVVQGILAILTVINAARALLGWSAFEWSFIDDRRYAGFCACVLATLVLGVHKRRLWARWSGLALGALGVADGMLNAPFLVSYRGDVAWAPILSGLCGATLWLGLSHPAVRQSFALAAKETLWTSQDTLVRWVRLAAIASLGAVPALVCYAMWQPIVLLTRPSAWLLAPLCLFGFLWVALARKTAGVLLLGLAGAGLIAQTVATSVMAYRAGDGFLATLYYAVLWAPAGVLGIFASVFAFARAERASCVPQCRIEAGMRAGFGSADALLCADIETPVPARSYGQTSERR